MRRPALELCLLTAVAVPVACSSEEPREAPTPAPSKPAPAAPGPAAPAAAPVTPRPEAARPPRPEPRAESGAPDYWYDRFHPYMPPDLRKRYLATARDDRFRVFGDQLLEYERRDALLEPHREKLTPEELERYHALPDVESCERFLRERVK